MGLNLDSQGVIIGTPARGQKAKFTVIVSDQVGSSVKRGLRIKIVSALAMANRGLPAGKQGKRYKTALEARGGKKPYAWTVASGSLPDGLTLNSATGKIAGTPSESGSFELVLQLTDLLGGAASRRFTLLINP